jgi:hypothetical protein
MVGFDMNTMAVQWTEIADAAGGIAAVVGVVGGAAIAVLYGRKATANVTAEVHEKDGEYVLAARPAISAAGVFRLKFAVADGITVRTTEVIRTDTGLEDGQWWDGEGVFEKAFVEGGETLTTMVLFLLGQTFPGLVGWRVSFGVNVERMLFGGPGWSWADQAFVPVPES